MSERDDLRSGRSPASPDEVKAIDWIAMWQPIETAPKDADVIITNGTAVGEAHYFADEDAWWWAGSSPTDFCDHKVWKPTHWMPLPEPPQR